MKRSLLLLGLVCLLGLTLIGCNRSGNPRNAVQQLHEAVEKGDRNAIADLMVPNAFEVLFKFYTLDQLQESYNESGGIASMQETIDNDTAVVVVTYRNGDESSYDLVRVDGKWLITLEK